MELGFALRSPFREKRSKAPAQPFTAEPPYSSAFPSSGLAGATQPTDSLDHLDCHNGRVVTCCGQCGSPQKRRNGPSWNYEDYEEDAGAGQRRNRAVRLYMIDQ